MVEAGAILARIAELPGGFAGSDPSRVAGWTALGATSSLELGPNGQLARLTQKDAESSVSVEYVFTPVDGATYLARETGRVQRRPRARADNVPFAQ